jgi:hypothetical protein
MVALSYDTATESVAVTATSGGASSDVVMIPQLKVLQLQPHQVGQVVM